MIALDLRRLPPLQAPTPAQSFVACHNPSFSLELAIKDLISLQDQAETLGIDAQALLSPPLSPIHSPQTETLMSPTFLSLDPPSRPDPADLPGPSTPSSLSPNLASSSAARIQLPEVEVLPPPPKKKGSAFTPKRKNRLNPISEHRRARRNASAHAARSKKAEQLRNTIDCIRESRPQVQKKYVDKATVFASPFRTDSPSIASSSHTGRRRPLGYKKIYSLEELVGPNSKLKLKLQKWDGRSSIGLLDVENRIVGVLAGHPDDENWPRIQEEAAHALESRRSRCSVPKKDRRRSRRGAFIALNYGISFGGGQRVPGNLVNVPQNDRVLKELNSLEPFKRMAGFASSVLSTWAPRLHSHYKQTMARLQQWNPSLSRPFPSSVFSAVAYNFGPQTICYPHMDFGNYITGMCSVSTAGNYDYTKGGHLVLWDLGLVVEFPPGSTILLPSALIAHSNVPIGKEERRYSFAQYSAGGLFRWVDNGFKTRENFLKSLSEEELAADEERQSQRWKFGLSLLSQVNIEASTPL